MTLSDDVEDCAIRLNDMSQVSSYWALQATRHSTPPAPQEAQEEKEKEKEQPLQQAIIEEIVESSTEKLHQATMEDIVENTAEEGKIEQQHGSSKPRNSIPNSTSNPSTIPRLCTTPASRDPAACLSIALFAYQHALILGLMVNTLPGSIQHSEGMECMEATGQG